MFTIATIIEIAQVSMPLVIRAIDRGLEKDLLLPQKIMICKEAVNDYQTHDPSNVDLPFVSNYLFALVGGYAFEAEQMIGQGGGGIAPTPGGGGGTLLPYPVYHVVTAGEANSYTLQNDDWKGLVYLNTTAEINEAPFTINSKYTFATLTGTFDFTNASYQFQEGDIFATGGYKTVT